MRESARGFLGRPTLSGHRNGKAWSTKFEVTDFHHQGNHCAVTLRDFHAELEVVVTFDLDAFGVLIQKATVKNIGNSDYVLNEFIHWLPLPREATQTLDFAGRWSNERQPQRRDIQIGTWVRESREGRSGHNFSIADIALTAQHLSNLVLLGQLRLPGVVILIIWLNVVLMDNNQLVQANSCLQVK